MMRLFIVFCLFIVAGSFLAYKIQQGSGYVLLVWGDTSIEMSLWFALGIVLVSVFVIYLVMVLIRGSVRSMSSAKQKITGYGADKAQQQTVSGLIDFIEGDWLPAQKKLTRAAKKVSSPIINYLAAARCAYEMDNEQEALQLLHRAEKSIDNAGLAVALTQARMQLANKQYEQALATLARAADINPQHNVVLGLQQQVYVAVKDWDALKKLLPKLHQKNIGSTKQRYQLEQMLYQERFVSAITKQSTLPDDKKLSMVQQDWASIPSHFQKDSLILKSYVEELIGLKQYDEAESLLLKGLSQEWNDQWVLMYGLIISSRPEKALKNAERWLKRESKNAVLLLTLGRLCLQNQQWGRARDFFTQSLGLQSKPETYAELARLQQYLGATEEAQKNNHQGLLASVKTLVNIPTLDS